MEEIKVKTLSRDTKGWAIDVFCLMANSDRYGYLTIGTRTMSDEQLASLTSCTAVEVAAYLAALVPAGVFKRDRNSSLFCPWMVEEQKRSNTNAENVAKRWSKQPSDKSEENTSRNTRRKPKNKISSSYEEDNTGDRNPPRGTPQPADYIFTGKIIRMIERDWEKLKSQHALNDDELARILDERDEFLAKLPETDSRRIDWWMPTISHLKAKAEGVRLSRRH